MKRISFIILALLFSLSGSAGNPNVITITANDVIDAQDIEFAINLATGYGIHPGTVILDSTDGDFSFTTSDKSINIFVSDLTLMSKNGARITNCEGAINFDALPASNVTIQGLTFVCSGDGITASDYLNKNINIQNNTIFVPGIGISFAQIEDSIIKKNVIQSDWGIHVITGSSRLSIMQNDISTSSIGIFLQDVDLNHVVNNRISSLLQGILIGNGSDDNHVIANRISNVQYSGIALEGNNYDNQIHGNKISCLINGNCLIIDSTEEVLSTNNISGNK